MFTIQYVDSSYTIVRLWTARAGAIIGIVITFILFINVSQNYRTIFSKSSSSKVKKNKLSSTTPKKLGFILVFTYIISGLIAQISNLFLRSNSLTLISIDSYNIIHCKTGYIISWIVGGIMISTLYLMFLYRIWIAFEGSVYQYNIYILKSFVGLTIIQLLVIISDRIIRAFFSDTQWIIEYDPKSGLLYCFADASQGGITVFIYFLALVYLVINGGLLYMFANGLYKLKKEMTALFAVEMQETSQMSLPDLNSIGSKSKSKTEKSKSSTTHSEHEDHDGTIVDIDDLARARSTSRSTTKDVHKKHRKHSVNKHKDDEKDMITKLHDLIKKQTILAFIPILSTFIWSIWGIFDPLIIQQASWIFLINIVCSWMMLVTSEKYYLFCTKYGLCKCCYF